MNFPWSEHSTLKNVRVVAGRTPHGGLGHHQTMFWSPHAFFNPVKFDPAKIGFEFKQHETVNLGIWNQQQTSDLDVYTIYMAKTMARLSSKIHSVDHLSGPTCPSQVHG